MRNSVSQTDFLKGAALAGVSAGFPAIVPAQAVCQRAVIA